MIAGAMLLIAGILMTTLGRMGFGKLPGDFTLRRGSFTVYLPLMTSLLLSVLLSLILWLLRR
jgi:hypothetical protein